MNILENPRSGRKSLLSMEDSKIIKEEVIVQNSQNTQCKVAHIEIVNDLVEKRIGKRYRLSGAYLYCKKIRIRKVKPRPVYIKNDPKLI